MSITLWKPEKDVVLHQALGKLAEECAELSQALARCLIQGFHEEEPVKLKLNRTQVMEEVADVKAAMRWLFDVLDEPLQGESQRERRKFDGFKRWEAMLEEDMISPEPASRATASAKVDVKTDRHLSEANHNAEREDDVTPHAAAIPPLAAEAKSRTPHTNVAVLLPCGIADPTTRDCPNMEEVGAAWTANAIAVTCAARATSSTTRR